MSVPADDDRIPGAVPPLPLPDFEYDDLEKGERIGTGGDADVYRATIDHNGYTYPVAVKEPRFEGTIQRRVVEKFETEAETWSGLNDHDNIVSVYGWGAEPLPWLGLEFMDGGTLDARIGSLDVAEALWLSGRIAEGIRYGHRHGIAHLDIKPTNVLLRDTPDGKWKYPKVSDWGLAKMLLEHSNSIEGISPTYAAPEQFDAKEYGSPDDITDIYQLGALVYALVAGEPPFSGSSTAVMQGVLQEEPDPPSAVNSAVPTAVDDVVLKTLAKEKGDRYEGVLPFRKELDRLFAEYIGGDVDTTTSGVAPPADEPTDQTSERSTDTGNDTTKADRSKTADAEPQTQSSSGSRDDGGSSSHSSTRQKTDDDDSSLVSRRTALGLVGVGVFGGGGWMAAQMGGNNDDESAGASVPTDTPTETAFSTRTRTPTETETPTETWTLLDDFADSDFSDWDFAMGSGEDIQTASDSPTDTQSMYFEDVDRTVYAAKEAEDSQVISSLTFWFRYNSENDNNLQFWLKSSSDNKITQIREYFGTLYVKSNRHESVTQVDTNTWYKVNIENISFSDNKFDIKVLNSNEEFVGQKLNADFWQSSTNFSEFEIRNKLDDNNYTDPLWVDNIKYR